MIADAPPGTGTTSVTDTAIVSSTTVLPPTITKSFSNQQIDIWFDVPFLTFTITNPAANPVALSGIAFTDTLPAGVTVYPAGNGVSGSCGGGTITTVPAPSSSISLSGATLAPGESCTFKVLVSSAETGSWTNTTSPVTSTNGGTGNSASASIYIAAEWLFFF
jgi:uncharacterized repeat protein (TIGR01451 family)